MEATQRTGDSAVAQKAADILCHGRFGVGPLNKAHVKNKNKEKKGIVLAYFSNAFSRVGGNAKYL